ncbi:hypothetical protein NE237_010312 [Protea cynaroides]|uniref:Uncharacterized protein n=1 Tax=Protea cynaroides TaxID=273540 RepID=A0A9Q0KZG6_9MAGN|nr:hypothetical protein NE237_010312 [Protea cynaroides]
MEPAKIDWKNVDSKFVEDEMYEHINAPTWIDFTAPEDYVDDEAWFCKPDCRHPKTVADFLKLPPSKPKHLRSASVSEIFPLGDWNRRDANLKKRGLMSSSNQPIPDPEVEKTTASKPPNKFNRENENKNPNFSTPQNHQSKIMKAEIKSSTEKKKHFNESPPLADSTESNRRPHLKSTLSARNLFGGRDILNQISEFCNELKKLTTRAKERENPEASNVKGSPPQLLSEIPSEWSERVKEKKPLLHVGEGSSETKEQKQRSTKRNEERNEETENIPIALDLKNVKRGDESLLMQVRTCPPSPQCFSSPRQALGPNKNTTTTTTTPLKPLRLKPTQGRGILQELKQSNTKQMKEEPGEGNAGSNKSISTATAAGAGTQVKSLDMFWFLKPCTFLSSVN